MSTNKRNPDSFSVALAQSADACAQLFRFRYRVAVEELKQQPPDADHRAKTLSDELDDGAVLLYVTSDDMVVATVRLNFGDDAELPRRLRKVFQLERFEDAFGKAYSFTSRLFIAQAWRGSAAPKLLLGAAYKLARERGARFDFCHCSPSLVPLYERLGYRQFADNFADESAGYCVPLVLPHEDLGHLNAVNSPFFGLACKFDNRQDTTIWFASEFGESDAHTTMDEDAFWRFLSERLHESPCEGIPILDGLSQEEAKRFLALGSVLACKRGDTIVRAGDVGKEMFVVLSGTVEVRGDAAGVDHRIASFGKGEVFGELGFLGASERVATVVASGDVEVLVLSQDFCRKAIDTMPEITVKVMLNLSLILCERLRLSTRHLLDTVVAQGAA